MYFAAKIKVKKTKPIGVKVGVFGQRLDQEFGNVPGNVARFKVFILEGSSQLLQILWIFTMFSYTGRMKIFSN